jgi:hypothetical protein
MSHPPNRAEDERRLGDRVLLAIERTSRMLTLDVVTDDEVRELLRDLCVLAYLRGETAGAEQTRAILDPRRPS